MKLCEIEYASALPLLNLSQDQLQCATMVGTIDQQPVYLIDTGSVVVAFMKLQERLGAYIAFLSHETNGYHDLMRIHNVRSPPGSITALMVFVYTKFHTKFRIRKHEALTPDGLKWLKHRIQHPRGFVIHDSQGHAINVADLDREWWSNKNSNAPGETEVLISHIATNHQVFETWHGALQPMWRYVGDEHDI